MALVYNYLVLTGQKLIEWSLKLYMLLLLRFFSPKSKKNVTFYIFCFVAYVFSNYGHSSNFHYYYSDPRSARLCYETCNHLHLTIWGWRCTLRTTVLTPQPASTSQFLHYFQTALLGDTVYNGAKNVPQVLPGVTPATCLLQV